MKVDFFKGMNKKTFLEEYYTIKKIELILYQIVINVIVGRNYLNTDKENFPKPLIDNFRSLNIIRRKFPDLDTSKMAESNKKTHYSNFWSSLSKVLDFYKKYNVSVLPIYLSEEKSRNCLCFVSRVLSTYSKFKFDTFDIYDKEHNPFSKQFYEYFQNLIRENIFFEINFKESKIGDVVIYYENSIRYVHIGLVYDDQFQIISKLGPSFLYISPKKFFVDTQTKIFRINDENYYRNFREKFIPVMERSKMSSEQIKRKIEKLMRDG